MDLRKKKIIILSHCLLNTNSKVAGFSPQIAGEQNLVSLILSKGYGIMQLPCPENRVYGSKRWGQSREQFDTPHFRKECQKMLLPYIDEILDYQKNGYEVAGIISVYGSPSCGYKASFSSNAYGGELDMSIVQFQIASGRLSDSSGIFIEEFETLLKASNLTIPFFNFMEETPDKSFEILNEVLI